MSSQHVMHRYKVPRASVNVEALAQQLAWYFKITAEDTQFLHKHATRRDELFAELYSNPDVKPSVAPHQFVPLGSDPDTHLIPANAEIERLTPPKTIEDRVARVHYAAAALMVFNQYKVNLALLDYADLRLQVIRRKRQIMDEFYNGEFVTLFPELAKRPSKAPSPQTPPTRTGLPTPPATKRSGVRKRVSGDEIDEFLRNPSTLVGKRFVSSPPPGQGDGGEWRVVAYAVREGDEGEVENEYQVVLAAFGEDRIPMDEGEVRFQLQHSKLAQ
ncbi:hypothetical protein GSI_14230 [Ganoderma sinense ZZ0214-1]|uniref:Uncharacterized protein n=1 Tax=Ganoderma sinense ZZ0214-1 TaxID=1077348 RepID=A0A2G8RSI4_9APHY|nr:hypothetical protein GSI_14230 [Ganoderma sinense ZZ0214-1]